MLLLGSRVRFVRPGADHQNRSRQAGRFASICSRCCGKRPAKTSRRSFVSTSASMPVASAHMDEHKKPWNPLSVSEISSLFSAAPFFWCLAGGIALELALGHSIREHSDIDVFLFRRDQSAARHHLVDWDTLVADPPGKLRYWPAGEVLDPSVHDVWCRKSPVDDWRFQLMMDDANGVDWVSRRDAAVSLPIARITRTTTTGVRYLAPEVQLYYKAKNPRPKDEIDFKAVVDSGIDLDVSWLRNVISRSYSSQHAWLASLKA